jgi:hypothetical protein
MQRFRFIQARGAMAVRNMAMDIASGVARRAFGFRNGCAHLGTRASNGLRPFRDRIVVLDAAWMPRTAIAGSAT